MVLSGVWSKQEHARNFSLSQTATSSLLAPFASLGFSTPPSCSCWASRSWTRAQQSLPPSSQSGLFDPHPTWPFTALFLFYRLFSAFSGSRGDVIGKGRGREEKESCKQGRSTESSQQENTWRRQCVMKRSSRPWIHFSPVSVSNSQPLSVDYPGGNWAGF